MRYSDFNNINIAEELGVSRVGRDTLIIARKAGKLSGDNVLDVGTGTGFISIYLATMGKRTEGIDISPLSIDLAKKNAKANAVTINYYESNLFNNVKKKYDTIVFNPPIGSASAPETAILIEKIKSYIPRLDFLANIYMLVFGDQRKKLVEKFLTDAKPHLKRGGTIIMFVYRTEINLLPKLKYTYTLFEEEQKIIAILRVKATSNSQ